MWQAIAATAGAIANPIMQVIQNKQNRKYADKQYQRERADSLSDWALQNEYNSPKAAMQRARDAGLNPHVVGAKGAFTDAAPIKTPDTPTPEGKAPQVDPQSLMAFTDLRHKEAQIDLLQREMTLRENEALLTTANTELARLRSEGQGILNKQQQADLDYWNSIRDTAIEKYKTGARMSKAQLQGQRNQNALSEQELFQRDSMNAETLKGAYIKNQNMLLQQKQMALDRAQTQEQTRKLKAEIKNIKANTNRTEVLTFLDQMEGELRKRGASFKDPAWQRWIQDFITNPDDAIKKVRAQGWKNFIDNFTLK